MAYRSTALSVPSPDRGANIMFFAGRYEIAASCAYSVTFSEPIWSALFRSFARTRERTLTLVDTTAFSWQDFGGAGASPQFTVASGFSTLNLVLTVSAMPQQNSDLGSMLR